LRLCALCVVALALSATQRVDIIVRFALPNRTFLGVAFDPQPTLDD
jgi:hypothetical protein